MVAAAGADELEHAGVAAFEAAVHDADRLAPDDRRPAVAGLTGQRECQVAVRLYAQPRVTAMVRARPGGGARTDSRPGTGHDVRDLGTAHVLTASHLAHRQAGEFLPLPGSGAAVSVITARYSQAPRSEWPAELDGAWSLMFRLCFLVFPWSGAYQDDGDRPGIRRACNGGLLDLPAPPSGFPVLSQQASSGCNRPDPA